MKRLLFAGLCLSCALGSLRAADRDPIETDGDKYHLVLENDKVRVLEYSDKPGDKTHQHHHPDFVLVTQSTFKRRLTMADGTVMEREFKPGEVVWMKAQTHIGENIGDTETHVLLIESKPVAPVPAK